MRRLYSIFLALGLLASAAFAQRGRQAEVKVQKTSMTRDQEVKIGKQAAAEVERTMEVVHNPDAEAWLNRIGQQLAKTPQANAYPYYFKLVNEESINAFALPGGPMYVHTGLIKAAANEDEVAGVLAHEMSHVALRHGAAQMSKQQTWGTVFGVVGAVLGGGGDRCGLLCEIGEAGAGIAGTSVLMRYSRNYEHDADLNGARMMASAGYDPMGLPNFFEKLQSQLGSAGEPKGLSLWLASHPATGSRIEYVSEDIKFYPRRNYASDTGDFPQIKRIVASLPPPRPKPAALLQAKDGALPRSRLPQGFKDYQATGFAIGYPGTWQAGQPQGGGSLYLVPQGGVKQAQNNGVELIGGAMIDYYVPENGATATLDATTDEFVKSLAKGDTNLHSERSTRENIGGKPALLTRLTTKTSYAQDPEQVIYLYTLPRDAGLWYMVLASPRSRLGDFDPLFRDMIQTIQFPN